MVSDKSPHGTHDQDRHPDMDTQPHVFHAIPFTVSGGRDAIPGGATAPFPLVLFPRLTGVIASISPGA